MANAALGLNSLPAERVRGCQFAQRFYNKAALLNDAWVLTNNPTLDNGISCDGVNQKAEHPGPVRGVQSVSFWITLGSTTEDILQLSAAHSIEVGAGTLTATGWAAPTFYVNGVATAVITAARSFVTVTTGTPFDLQEALDYTNNATWGWENLLDINLQMRTADYDLPNVRTLDSSGYGTHFTLGDGGTPATYPTQGAGRMGFDGGDYLRRALVAQPAGAFTEAVMHIITNLGATQNLVGHGNVAGTDLSSRILRLNTGIYRFYTGGGGYVFTSAYDDTLNHDVVGVWDGTNAYIYVDGVLDVVGTFGAPSQPAGADQPFIVGAAFNLGNALVGDIFDFKYRDGQAWTPTQVADYHISQMRVLGHQL